MKRLLLGIATCALLGFESPAQEPAKAPPAAAAPAPGAEFLERFDLDKNGSVTFEEFQKVKSGFAALDADGDGAITQAEIAKVAEERRARMQKAMEQRMKQARRGRGMGRGALGPWGRGRGAGLGFGTWGRGGFGAGGDICPWCQQPCGQGAMGPGRGAGPRGPMGAGPGRGRGGRGMGWGFGAGGPWWDAPQEGTPPPPPQR